MKEVYKLEDFNDFIFAHDVVNRELGWIMVMNSIDFKEIPIEELVVLEHKIRRNYLWTRTTNKIIQKTNKAIYSKGLSDACIRNLRGGI